MNIFLYCSAIWRWQLRNPKPRRGSATLKELSYQSCSSLNNIRGGRADENCYTFAECICGDLDLSQPQLKLLHLIRDAMNDEHLDAPTIAPRDSANDDQAGSVANSLPKIPGYDVVRELGAGGTGRVYLGRNQTLDRLVAIKTMLSSDEDLASILLTEARIASKLNHSGIVPIYEANASGELWYFAMGLVEGEDLARRISRETYSPNHLVELTKQICDALDHAHGNNVLHLDIKPANILLDRQGNPKLADFGLSAFFAARKKDGVFGTPQFMPPEQALGDKKAFSPASDIYSLGAVMYAALAGRPPIISANPQDLLLKVVSQAPLRFRAQGLQIPAVLEAIILKCLAKSQSDRYTSALELKADLIAFERNEPTLAKPLNAFSQSIYFVQRHLLAASVSGSIVIILLLLTISLAIRSSSQAMELMDVTDEISRLREERGAFERRLRATLSTEQKQGFELAVTNELALLHADRNEPELARVYAARSLMTASSLRIPIEPALKEILVDYAVLLGRAATEDEALLKLAKEIVDEDDKRKAVKAEASLQQAASPETISPDHAAEYKQPVSSTSLQQ